MKFHLNLLASNLIVTEEIINYINKTVNILNLLKQDLDKFSVSNNNYECRYININNHIYNFQIFNYVLEDLNQQMKSLYDVFNRTHIYNHEIFNLDYDNIINELNLNSQIECVNIIKDYFSKFNNPSFLENYNVKTYKQTKITELKILRKQQLNKDDYYKFEKFIKSELNSIEDLANDKVIENLILYITSIFNNDSHSSNYVSSIFSELANVSLKLDDNTEIQQLGYILNLIFSDISLYYQSNVEGYIGLDKITNVDFKITNDIKSPNFGSLQLNINNEFIKNYQIIDSQSDLFINHISGIDIGFNFVQIGIDSISSFNQKGGLKAGFESFFSSFIKQIKDNTLQKDYVKLLLFKSNPVTIIDNRIFISDENKKKTLYYKNKTKNDPNYKQWLLEINDYISDYEQVKIFVSSFESEKLNSIIEFEKLTIEERKIVSEIINSKYFKLYYENL